MLGIWECHSSLVARRLAWGPWVRFPLETLVCAQNFVLEKEMIFEEYYFFVAEIAIV